MKEKENRQGSETGQGPSGRDLAEKAASALADKKGEDMLILDVRGISSVTDYMLIVSGNSSPHLKAMLNGTEKDLKTNGVYCYRKAGSPESGWIILDYSDVVIHIFSKEKRGYYSIEDLWNQARRIHPGTEGR